MRRCRNHKMTARQEQAQETRRKLLDSALKLFAEHGYADTHVRKINRSIDLADGILYHYFPGGKEELLQVLIKDHFEQITIDMKIQMETLRTLPIEEALDHFFRGVDEAFTTHLPMLKILFRESKARDMLEHDKTKELFRHNQSWLPEFLKERAEAGEIRKMDYHCAAYTLKAIVMNHFLMKLTEIDASNLSDPEHRKRLIEYQISLWKE
jgi:Transcriptional regulator